MDKTVAARGTMIASMRAGWLLLLPIFAACAQDIRVGDREDARTTNNRDASTTDDDASSTNGDATSNGDTARQTDGGAPAPDVGTIDAGLPACFVDPFARCDDPAEAADTDNEWHDAKYLTTNSIGCRTGDNLTALDTTVTGKICASDPADWMQLNMVCCDTRTLIVEIRLRALNMCDPAAYQLQLSGYDCTGDPNTRCRVENGEKIIETMIPPCSVVFGLYWAVEKLQPNVELDYELHFVLR